MSGEKNGSEQLLQIDNMSISLFSSGKKVDLIKGISIIVPRKTVVAIVGESGCGKTLTCLSILGLLPYPPIKVTGGRILFKGQDLLSKKPSEMREIRGKQISMIFQEHLSALNPTMTVGRQVMEVFQTHLGLGAHHAKMRTIELFRMVGISDAEQRIGSYPHELSGGMCQRVVIAMAIACRPSLIIADEPTTALDVTIQAQVLDLIRRLGEDFETSVLFVSHDLGIVAHMASIIYVMYAGMIVEIGGANDIFSTPLHPYTLSLLGSVPRLEEVAMGTSRLKSIKGAPPKLDVVVTGCVYAPRCEYAFSRCAGQCPPLIKYSEGRYSRCFLID